MSGASNENEAPYEHADQVLNRNQSSAHSHASEVSDKFKADMGTNLHIIHPNFVYILSWCVEFTTFYSNSTFLNTLCSYFTVCTLEFKRRASFIRKKREEAVSAGKAEPDAFTPHAHQSHLANGDAMETIDENEEKEFSTSTEFTPAVRTEEVKYIQPGERTSEG